ncbi:F0F1 ATP synthase subunit A [Persicobacter psychrovividus]|uniref:ATP synthase subunit a n=1 Tax=Persicobacter psychrovividus TaxID=387638 RepID=A0ABM7VGX9_9BACT|nr:ATP synthase subunit a [Persicobacter psychrovividus]
MNATRFKRLRWLLACTMVFMTLFTGTAWAADSGGHSAQNEEKEFNAKETIFHHILDAHEWHFFDGPYGTLYLPVIVYSKDKGLEVFSSSNFYNDQHEEVAYNGYEIEHGHITLEGKPVLDLSITKNVASMLLSVVLLLAVFLSISKGYKTKDGKVKAPKGLVSFLEPLILFVRDDIVVPNIGEKDADRFMNYHLTLFFFILFNNLLGLLPGAANLTGNIAVTVTLAVFTFIVTTISAKKPYWSHIFNPPVPLALKPMMIPIEFIGIFTKPFALTVRLFANITAGHIMILVLISFAFIFKSVTVGVVSSSIATMMMLLEILVAFIQAYVFALLSAIFIGIAMEEAHH